MNYWALAAIADDPKKTRTNEKRNKKTFFGFHAMRRWTSFFSSLFSIHFAVANFYLCHFFFVAHSLFHQYPMSSAYARYWIHIICVRGFWSFGWLLSGFLGYRAPCARARSLTIHIMLLMRPKQHQLQQTAPKTETKKWIRGSAAK